MQATNYTAEYGGHAGANVQLQLKSGTNNFRGAVFDYMRNDAMDARNFFAPAPSPKPQLDRHQFGGVIGGPVRRNQTFFMGSYEGDPRNARERGPDERADRGDAARRLLGRRRRHHPRSADRPRVPQQRHPGQPARSAGGLDDQQLSAAAQSDRRQQLPRPDAHRGHDQNQFITRVDHVLGQRQKIFGHYVYQGRDNPTIPINPEFPVARLFNNHSAAVQHVTTWSASRPERDALRLHARRPQSPEPAARRPGSPSRTTSGFTGCWSAGRTAGRRTRTRSGSRRSTSRASTGSATTSAARASTRARPSSSWTT